jgi:hypothetical protein
MSGATDELRQNARREGGLQLLLCEYVWNDCWTMRLGGEEFELVGSDDVPGYEDEDDVVLLRRKSDGQVFDVEIDVTMRPVRKPEKGEATA